MLHQYLRKNKYPTLIMGLVIIITLSSCMFFPGRRYHVMFRNMTYHEIVYDAGKIGSYALNAGTIWVPSKKNFMWCTGTSLDHLGAIPETVTIKWKQYDGEQIDYSNPVQGSGIIVKKVIVKAHLPKEFQDRDTIVFNITDKNQVILSFEMRKYKYEVNSKGERVFYGYTNEILNAKNLPDFFKTDGFKKYFDEKRKHNQEQEKWKKH